MEKNDKEALRDNFDYTRDTQQKTELNVIKKKNSREKNKFKIGLKPLSRLQFPDFNFPTVDFEH